MVDIQTQHTLHRNAQPSDPRSSFIDKYRVIYRVVLSRELVLARRQLLFIPLFPPALISIPCYLPRNISRCNFVFLDVGTASVAYVRKKFIFKSHDVFFSLPLREITPSFKEPLLKTKMFRVRRGCVSGFLMERHVTYLARGIACMRCCVRGGELYAKRLNLTEVRTLCVPRFFYLD